MVLRKEKEEKEIEVKHGEQPKEIFNPLEVFESSGDDKLKTVSGDESMEKRMVIEEALQNTVPELEALKHKESCDSSLDKKYFPSILKEPKLELKPLPDHLKYEFLGDGKNFPVIVPSKLRLGEEKKL